MKIPLFSAFILICFVFQSSGQTITDGTIISVTRDKQKEALTQYIRQHMRISPAGKNSLQIISDGAIYRPIWKMGRTIDNLTSFSVNPQERNFICAYQSQQGASTSFRLKKISESTVEFDYHFFTQGQQPDIGTITVEL